MVQLSDAIYRETGDGIVLGIRVTPKAGADAIGDLREAANGAAVLNIRITQPPENGKANKAVIALLAKRLGFAKSAMEIVAGETRRDKQIRISGRPGAIIDALQGIVCADNN